MPRRVQRSVSAARLAVVVAACACSAQQAIAQPPDALGTVRMLESVLVEAIARAEGAVVAVTPDDVTPLTQSADPFDPLGRARLPLTSDAGQADFPLKFGSGVVVAAPEEPAARFVLTTCQVAFGDEHPAVDRTFRVTLRHPQRGSITLRGRPVAADRRIDLAVLRLDLDGARLDAASVPTLAIGDAADIRKGRFVIALGNPYAMARDGSTSASIGIVSNISRRPFVPLRDAAMVRDSPSIHEYGTLLTVDTRLQLGASGGALLNLDGELIGITTALAAIQGYEKSAGYAIPFDAGTRRIIGELLRGYEAEYGFLGISPEPYRWAADPDQSIAAVRAAHVAVDSPAAQAELRPQDLILQINGQAVHDVSDLMRIIGLLGPGVTAELLVQHGREAPPQTIQSRLGKWPVYDDRDVLSTRERHPAWRGLTVDYPTARQRFLSSDRLEQYRRAVVVTHVAEGSAAFAAGLKIGDFIASVETDAVQTPQEFFTAATARAGRVRLQLWDKRTVVLEP